MNFEFIKNNECSQEQILKICRLKEQHWNYSLREQEEWLKSNLAPDDIHLLLEDEGCLIGYLSLVSVDVIYRKDCAKMLGIGSVCVDKEYLGKYIGRLLMSLVNYYLRSNRKQGILLCNKKLIDFYIKSGWYLFCGDVYHQGNYFEKFTLFSEIKEWEKVNISKLF